MWKLFQLVIFCSVVGSNIHWKWTPNGYLAGFLGFIAAWLATALLTWLFSLRRQQRLPEPQEGLQGHVAGRIEPRRDW